MDVISSVVTDCEKIAIKENYRSSVLSLPLIVAFLKTIEFVPSRGGIQDKVVFVKDCIESIKHINSFMLMSINRCIDYTKASNGVKLVPRLETVDLTEIITLPIHIMKVSYGPLNAHRNNVLCNFSPLFFPILGHPIEDDIQFKVFE